MENPVLTKSAVNYNNSIGITVLPQNSLTAENINEL